MRKETEPAMVTQKLIEAAAGDYPAAAEILVSFPDLWSWLAPSNGMSYPCTLRGYPPVRRKAGRTSFSASPTPSTTEGYQEFLTSLGYGPDLEFPHWWGKEE